MHKFVLYILLSIIAAINCSCIVKSLNPTQVEAVQPTKGYGTLSNFPFKEAWYGLYFQEDKIGYSHFKIQPQGENFIIESDSMMRLTAMKKTNEITMNEKITVAPDLSLISFDSTVKMNQKNLKVEGQIESSTLLLKMDADGEKLEREFPLKGKIFHTSAISLMPAMKGLKDGSKYSFDVFNVERQSIETVDQEISKVKGAPGPSDAVWKVTNNYGKSVVISWLNRKGLVVLEKGLDGSLITILEDEESAKKFLEQKAQQKDLVLDFSLVKTPRKILSPAKTKFLKAHIQGVQSEMFARDHRQTVKDSTHGMSGSGFDVEVQVEDLKLFKGAKGFAMLHTRADDAGENLSRYLVSTSSIQSDHQDIKQQAGLIVSGASQDLEKIVNLVNWTADNIKGSMRDSFSSLDVLKSKEGECQSHSKLYTAMARSVGIPTRLVTGLVYSDNLGFLYHSWAESYVKGWLSVDPTLRQVPSDATHIKLVSLSDDDPGPVLKVMGKIKIESVDYQ